MRKFHNHFCNFKGILSRRFRKITISQLTSFISNSFLYFLPTTHLLNIPPMYKFKKFYRQIRTNDYSFFLLQHVSKYFFLEIPTFSHESQLSRFIIRTNFDFPQSWGIIENIDYTSCVYDTSCTSILLLYFSVATVVDV